MHLHDVGNVPLFLARHAAVEQQRDACSANSGGGGAGVRASRHTSFLSSHWQPSTPLECTYDKDTETGAWYAHAAQD